MTSLFFKKSGIEIPPHCELRVEPVLTTAETLYGAEAEVNEVKNPPPTWLLPASVFSPYGAGHEVRLDALRPTALFLLVSWSTIDRFAGIASQC
jgi:hypothetical protein